MIIWGSAASSSSKKARKTYLRMVQNIQMTRYVSKMAQIDKPVIRFMKDNHLNDLQETFDTLQLYNMKLNPNKCVFGVTVGKFLGFMVS